MNMSEQRQAVFIVDDDASVRKSLLRLFRSAGLHAESFASAHDFLNREHFDGNKCLVLDIRMPEVNGIDLFQKLSRAEYNLQVVFLTGHGDISTGVQMMKEGAIDFLTKPVDDEQILNAVRTALAKDANEREQYFSVYKIRQQLRKPGFRRRRRLARRVSCSPDECVSGVL